jgi:hypothetical protein
MGYKNMAASAKETQPTLIAIYANGITTVSDVSEIGLKGEKTFKTVTIITAGEGDAKISVTLPRDTLAEVMAIAIHKIKIPEVEINAAKIRLGF